MRLDYDLCTPCISSGAAEAHDPFHEFFDITEPGRVVVHTVFSGDGERAPMNSGRSELSVPSVGQLESQRPVVHRATCDLCDSRIVGDRYVCHFHFKYASYICLIYSFRNVLSAQTSIHAARASGKYNSLYNHILHRTDVYL